MFGTNNRWRENEGILRKLDDWKIGDKRESIRNNNEGKGGVIDAGQ